MYIINLENKFFLKNGEKVYFSSNDKIYLSISLCDRNTTYRVKLYLKQFDENTHKSKLIEIDKELAEELINDANVNIKISEDSKINSDIIDLNKKTFSIGNRKYSYESSNCITVSVDIKEIKYYMDLNHYEQLDGEIPFVIIPPYIAQCLINCAHLKVKL